MPGVPGPEVIKICKRCGDEYHPKSARQQCCNKPIQIPCEVCGKPMDRICTFARQNTTCSKECSTELGNRRRWSEAQKLTKICQYCGKEFHPKKSPKEVYCDGPHFATCEICGKKFEITGRIDLANKTCSDRCRYISAQKNTDTETMVKHWKATIQDKYGVTNIMQLQEFRDKVKETTQRRYGDDSYTRTQEYKNRVKETSISKYGTEHPLASPEVRNKIAKTVESRYGASNIFASEYGKAKIHGSLMAKYGVSNPSQHPDMKRKATQSARKSGLEVKIKKLLTQYNIEYVEHYHLSDGRLNHEYDFYLPQYRILIDADGVYYHSYISDPDGVRVRDDYDDVRLQLVPKDHIFHLIVEGHEESGVKQLTDIISSINSSTFNYDSEMFKWCRSMSFPYPGYTKDRMDRDYKSLCNRKDIQTYNPNSRLGESIIRNYHKSIYSAHCGTHPSPVDGWNNDEILKKVILNRLIYVNDVDPSKILRGLYISKLAPRVSVFNPVLAKYIIDKYLNEYDEIFDPFSGYSGRLIGTAASGKFYIGRDINEQAVAEANLIINDFNLQTCNVTVADVLSSSGSYQCLLTCPPYNKKEIYAKESVFKSCDGWIDECLVRFKCRRYVFVVDVTDKYSQYIVEDITTKSYLNTVLEHVIVIDK